MSARRAFAEISENQIGKRSINRTPLDFEVTESPPWRERLSKEEQDKLASVPNMLDEIVKYWESWEDSKERYRDQTEKVLNNMRLEFILRTNQGEDIGTQTLEETRNALVNESNQPSKCEKERVTKNIREAMKKLQSTVHESPESECVGLIEETSFIQDIHKVLMKGVMKQSSTPAGEYCTEDRIAEFEGEEHWYPKFDSKEDANKKVTDLVHNYNFLVVKIKNISAKKEKIRNIFKLAAWFFFELISLHPFGDGNGRLCRLLCSYVLSIITPFPAPVYNVHCPSDRNDYVRAIVTARKSENRNPSDLAAMIIECTFHGWRKFQEQVQGNQIMQTRIQS